MLIGCDSKGKLYLQTLVNNLFCKIVRVVGEAVYPYNHPYFFRCLSLVITAAVGTFLLKGLGQQIYSDKWRSGQIYPEVPLRGTHFLTEVCCDSSMLWLHFSFSSSALMESLITPLQDKIEDWKKTANQLDKDHAKGKTWITGEGA